VAPRQGLKGEKEKKEKGGEEGGGKICRFGLVVVRSGFREVHTRLLSHLGKLLEERGDGRRHEADEDETDGLYRSGRMLDFFSVLKQS